MNCCEIYDNLCWQIFIGVITSVIVTLVFFYGRKILFWFDKRQLKNIFGYNGKRGVIITPIYRSGIDKKKNNLQQHPDLIENKIVYIKDAYALSYLMELHHQLRFEAEIIPHSFINENSLFETLDCFVLASKYSNEITGFYIDKRINSDNFSIVDDRDETEKSPPPEFNSESMKFGFRILNEDYPCDNETDYGVLIKISETVLDKKQSIHLIFGLTGTGTAGAAYYLYKNYKTIAKKHGKKQYLAIVQISRRIGHKHVKLMKSLDLN